jgi:iron complex transport system substrate-binding protein
MAQLIKDAGGHYLWENINQSASFQVSLEEIFAKNDSIDILLNPGFVANIDEIIATDSRLSKLLCIKNNRVFNNDKLKNNFGSLYFYEQGIVMPDAILSDLIHIFYDDNIQDSSLIFYHKLKKGRSNSTTPKP